ncbi:carbohydrate ABC transporter permease [Maritalea mediterranea]|uniref:Maltose/maltodextrin transport system permease protein MalG n=1 Tax=Maritalea mediterranea TaxID=2909667 RepID=A0ABS9E451_9HYPH|nr:carbohydrate ABC transporter permease [Maritalea mediterranea]MCF4097577.1 carbohydrate ABC transporter permease [Maritalea mediterranea]
MINKYRWYEIVGIYIGIAIFLTFILAPFIEAFLVSLRPWREIVSIPYEVFTDGMSFDAYFTVWNHVPLLGHYIWNSFFIASSVTILTLIAVIPAAWAFGRFEFKGREVLLTAFLTITMIGPTVFILPLFKIFLKFGLLDTYWAVILPGATFLIPVGIWLLRSYMLTIPRELEEAAWVDGASRLYILRRVIIPIAMPGIAVVAIATFIGAYSQQFVIAFAFLWTPEMQPLPLGLYPYAEGSVARWNDVMAASLIGILPVMLIFPFVQRRMVAGLTAGAVKQ